MSPPKMIEKRLFYIPSVHFSEMRRGNPDAFLTLIKIK